MSADPYEMHDIAEQHPDIVASMKKGYEEWFKDVSSTRGFDPPRIHIGSPHEAITVLTRQDWRGPEASWGPTGLGYWEVQVEKAGRYEVTVGLPKNFKSGKLQFRLGKTITSQPVKESDGQGVVLANVELTEGPGRLEAWIDADDSRRGVWSVEVRKKE